MPIKHPGAMLSRWLGKKGKERGEVFSILIAIECRVTSSNWLLLIL